MPDFEHRAGDYETFRGRRRGCTPVRKLPVQVHPRPAEGLTGGVGLSSAMSKSKYNRYRFPDRWVVVSSTASMSPGRLVGRDVADRLSEDPSLHRTDLAVRRSGRNRWARGVDLTVAASGRLIVDLLARRSSLSDVHAGGQTDTGGGIVLASLGNAMLRLGPGCRSWCSPIADSFRTLPA